MNSAETAAACRICAHRQNSSSGVRNIPPPVPVSPARNPRPAPTLIATGADGGDACGGSLRRSKSLAEEKSSTTAITILTTDADCGKYPPKYTAGLESNANGQTNSQEI